MMRFLGALAAFMCLLWSVVGHAAIPIPAAGVDSSNRVYTIDLVADTTRYFGTMGNFPNTAYAGTWIAGSSNTFVVIDNKGLVYTYQMGYGSTGNAVYRCDSGIMTTYGQTPFSMAYDGIKYRAIGIDTSGATYLFTFDTGIGNPPSMRGPIGNGSGVLPFFYALVGDSGVLYGNDSNNNWWRIDAATTRCNLLGAGTAAQYLAMDVDSVGTIYGLQTSTASGRNYLDTVISTANGSPGHTYLLDNAPWIIAVQK